MKLFFLEYRQKKIDYVFHPYSGIEFVVAADVHDAQIIILILA
jgi:hypothetical protein